MPGILVGIITAIHFLVCVGLMVVILLQSGKGGGLAGAFGAGSSQTLFGGRGAADFLSRSTTVLAAVFFVTSLTLGLAAAHTRGTGQSLITQEARQRAQQRAAQQGAGAPAAPAPTPSAPPGGSPATAPGGPAPSVPAPSGGTGK
jgi:preprotein translocase subunit SecG